MFVTIILFICALGLSGIAGYYSIIGMAAIFASAYWPVVIMTGVLETSKLVISSWLYQKWNIVPVFLKVYLTIAVFILVCITSLGIFGFLSRAHIDQNLDHIANNIQIEQIDSKISSIKLMTARYEGQLKQLDRAIDIQLDEKRGVLAGQERKKQEQERELIRKKLDDDVKALQELQLKKSELKQQESVIESKVGPIKYVAEFFTDGKEVDLDKAVRWMILIIVFVFDPLAVLMVIAANIGFKHWALSKKKTVTTDQPPVQPIYVHDTVEIPKTDTTDFPDQRLRHFEQSRSAPRFVSDIVAPESEKTDLTKPVIIAQATVDEIQSPVQDIITLDNSQPIQADEPVVDALDADKIIEKLKARKSVGSNTLKTTTNSNDK